VSDRPAEIEPWRRKLHAAFYALHLQQQGLTPADAAELVMARYPATRPLLTRLVKGQKADQLQLDLDDEERGN
jgi:hypothetical protein